MTNSAGGDVPLVMLVVAAALIDPDGRVLMQRRPPGKPLAGLWEFPGGKVERAESPEAALARELDEELGIAVALSALAPAGFTSEPFGNRHLLLLLFRCQTWRGEPEGRDGQELAWVPPADLEALPMPAADRPLAAALFINAA